MKSVKRLRESCGLTQEQLAEEIGVSGPMVNHYETGRNQITPANAMRLVEICHRHGIKTSLEEIYEEISLRECA